MTTESKIKQVAEQIRKETLGEKSEVKRFETVARILGKSGLSYNFLDGEKSHAGAVGTIKKSRRGYRINYRCGYGKHNYAPVVEIID